jgi:hypothetical protein
MDCADGEKVCTFGVALLVMVTVPAGMPEPEGLLFT